MRFYLKRRTADLSRSKLRGFTVLELIVAVSVTAVLSGMLLLISRQVLETQSVSSAELERNQIAHFVLDQIQEDLQCALYRNDGNVWMAMSLLNQSDNSGSWIEPKKSSFAKPPLNSLRIIESDWPSDALQDAEIDSLGQGPFAKSRFGLAGTWLRFFTQSPELDPQAKGDGAARAVSYQIIRYGITGSSNSRKRYHLFRSDVSAKNTFEAGYNLHPENDSWYGSDASNISVDPNFLGTPRVPSTLINPVIEEGGDYLPTSFSLATNIIDFGIRAYHLEKNSFGTGNLVQIFPPIDQDSPGNLLAEEFLATSHIPYQVITDPTFYLFPDVVDVMVRVLSEEGARILESFENGDFPNTEEVDWWSIAEEHSKVYFRRIKIYGSGI
jgi:type II secretory pathway pseudopilin PulG